VRLLAGVSYDPAAAVTKATTALLAMTAFDTTNLRLASITVPSHGMLRWRIICTVHGAATLPSILLGVMEGATVRGRISPMVGGGNLVATGRYQHEATGLITGLTGGASITLDAAYGVEVLVASTGIKYGGPNNATTNDAFGAIVFEVFDPAPAAGSGSGATAQEVWEYATRTLTSGANIALAKGTGVTGFNDITAGNVRTELATELGRIDVAVSTRLAGASYTAPSNADIAAIKLKTDNLPSDPADASVIAARFDTVDAAIAAIQTGGGGGLDAAGVRAAIGLASANLDTQLSGLSTAIATVDTVVDGVKLKTDGLPPDPADASVVAAATDAIIAAIATRLAAASYEAPDNTGIAAIKTQTDKMMFTVANKLDVNMLYVNGVQVIGAGTAANRWRGAT
jgi:hypothetical protein